jgi:hypothetical protein
MRLLESVSGAVQIAAHLLLYPLLRGSRRRWGTTELERTLELPGDELVPESQWTFNHAISIEAAPAAVWPWLVQVGAGRGGFCSYEGLENLVGCEIRNVFEIRPELQHLKLGEKVVLHGRSGFGPEMVSLEPVPLGARRPRRTRRDRRRRGGSTCSTARMGPPGSRSAAATSPGRASVKSSASAPT